MSPVIGYFIVTNSFSSALYLLLIAGFTDFLDGYIARKFNMKTSWGSVLDPAADKILMTTLAVSLMYSNILPLGIGGLIIGRDVFLMLRTFYKRYESLEPPKTWQRYWDVNTSTAEIKPTAISKVNTFLQLSLMFFSLTGTVYGFADHFLMDCLRYTVAATTIISFGQLDTRPVLERKDASEDTLKMEEYENGHLALVKLLAFEPIALEDFATSIMAE
ncbi:hypothetical protein HK103_007342 [Boothiomyces macroporosus]|uniref:Phosphatidyl synthase n=1 Tax=Boothiomyces macroporosus TaxID=261099 RepID=A0AAD5Y5M0_9FUNG|nr:hypothetical protein HK103_007342 [Boothiomyces macroporosus]